MSKVVIIGAGLGIGVLGVLWWRSRQASTPAKSGLEAACETVANAAGVPPELCKAAGAVKAVGEAVVHAVGGKLPGDVAKWDADNKRLNGDVAIELTPALKHLAKTCTDPHHCFPALDGTVVKFKNGCVPMKNVPGWEKCAPGTHPMFNYGVSNAAYWRPDETRHQGSGYKPSSVHPMSGRVRLDGEPNGPVDPFTSGGFDPSKSYDVEHFPIPIPSGHVGYFWKAKPFTCPKGSPPTFRGPNGEVIRDTRGLGPDDDAYVPPCGSGGTWTNPTGPGRGVVVDNIGRIDDACADPRFTMDTLPDGTKYCRRKRVGE